MAIIETFQAYGENFRFEPPVDTGEHVIDSLGKLAAVASLGANSHIDIINTIANGVDASLAQSHEASGVRELANVLTRYSSHGRMKHNVSME